MDKILIMNHPMVVDKINNALNKNEEPGYIILSDAEDGLIEYVPFSRLKVIKLDKHENWYIGAKRAEKTDEDDTVSWDATDILILGDLRNWALRTDTQLQWLDRSTPPPEEEPQKIPMLEVTPIAHLNVHEMYLVMKALDPGGDWDTWDFPEFKTNAWDWIKANSKRLIEDRIREDEQEGWKLGYTQGIEPRQISIAELREVAEQFWLSKIIEGILG
jgi:hypothetical protein